MPKPAGSGKRIHRIPIPSVCGCSFGRFPSPWHCACGRWKASAETWCEICREVREALGKAA